MTPQLGHGSQQKTIHFYLSLAGQLLILIERSFFNQSFFNSINFCYLAAWGGHLWGKKEMPVQPFYVCQSSWVECKYFMRMIDLLWIRRKILTLFSLQTSCVPELCRENIKNWFSISLGIHNSSYFKGSVSAFKCTFCSRVREWSVETSPSLPPPLLG